MKKITFVLFAFIAGTAFGQESANATVSADIVSPITIKSNGDNLNFGKVLKSTGGTVTVSPDGTRNGTNSIIVESSAFSAATFTINAAEAYNFTIAIPDITLNNGTDDLEVTDFNHNLSSLEGTGTDLPFNIGGTLNVETTDSDGAYTGTVTVTVAYQ